MSATQTMDHTFLGDATFIEGELLRALDRRQDVAESNGYRFRLADTEDPTKITAEYTLADGTRLFAKVYSGDREDGAHTFQVMAALREQGLGEGSRYQVAEPVVYLPHRRVLVQRGVPGVCLVDYLGTSSPQQFQGVCEAARWLAHLHSAPVWIGRPWQIWQNFYRLGHRLAKATAERPGYGPQLRRMLEQLASLAATAQTPPRLVQTQGQYRDVHVFLSDQVVSVIDFDRSLPADPAKDLDEFLHRLRWKTFKHTRGQADELTAAFLREYTAAALPENVANLPFYWAYHALYSLARFVNSKEPGHPDWDEVIAFYTGEFETAAAGRIDALIGGGS